VLAIIAGFALMSFAGLLFLRPPGGNEHTPS